MDLKSVQSLNFSKNLKEKKTNNHNSQKEANPAQSRSRILTPTMKNQKKHKANKLKDKKDKRRHSGAE